jgi:hypothetical protein
MQTPALNSVCYYTFQSRFSALTGIYQLVEVMTFDDAVSNSIDLVNSCYIPAGLTSNDYENDWANYQDDIIMGLMSVTDSSTTYYIPSTLMDTVPDPTVSAYDDIAIVIQVGTYKDSDIPSWILNEINGIVTKITGTENPAVMVSLDTQYLTQNQYDTLKEERKANAIAYNPLYQQIVDQNKTIQSQKTLITELQKIIVDLTTTSSTS